MGSWMALQLQNSFVRSCDLISVGSTVLIRGSATRYRVCAISRDRSDACLVFEPDTCIWCSLSDLVFVQTDKNCHFSELAGLAVLVTPPLSLMGETHAT